MKSFGLRSGFSGRFRPGLAPFQAFACRFGKQQAHLCLPHHRALAHLPQIGQRKQQHNLLRVLPQPPVACLGITELLLDDPKRVFYLGADTGLDLLDLLEQLSAHLLHVQQAPLAGHHGHMPAHIGVLRLDFVALAHAPIARVGKDVTLLAVQQRSGLGDIVRIGCDGGDVVHHIGVGIDSDVGFHAKVPLLALLGLMHVGVALAAVVLGGAGGGDERGVHDGALPEQQPFAAEFGVDAAQNLGPDLVRLQEVAKAQDGALVGQARHARIEVGELAVQWHVVQRFFHGGIGQAKELLQQVDAQHGLERKGWSAHALVGRVLAQQGKQCLPRNYLVHLIEELVFAGALDGQLESAADKADLFHGRIVSCQAFRVLTFADIS